MRKQVPSLRRLRRPGLSRVGMFSGVLLPPAIPTNLAATTDGGAVALTWDAVTGATSYQVWRGTSSGAETLYDTSATNSYSDTGATEGTAYYYKVKAVGAGGPSAFSNEVSITTFTPADVATLTVDLRSDAGTYQNDAMSTPATAYNDPVAAIADHSGNAHHLTAGTNHKLLTNGLNGRPIVRCNAQAGHLFSGTISLTQPYTVYMVFRLQNLNSDRSDIWGDNVSTTFLSDLSQKWFLKAGGVGGTTNVAEDSKFHVFKMRINGASSGFTIDNGTEVAMNLGGDDLASINLMDVPTYLHSSWTDFAQWIVYHADIANGSANDAKLNAYLTNKWAPGSVPNTYTVASGGLGYEAFPGLLKLANTNLLCFYRDGSLHASDDGIVKCKTSSTSGATWGSAVTVFSWAHEASSDNSQIQLASGRIVAIIHKVNGGTHQVDSPVRYSDDNGATWGDLGTITASNFVIGGTAQDSYFGYGHIREVSAGGELLTAGYTYKSGVSKSVVLTSSDSGVTWSLKGVVDNGTHAGSPNETDIINVSGTNWLAAYRADEGIWTATSSDGGTTWTGWTLTLAGSSGEYVSPSFLLSGTTLYMYFGRRGATPGLDGVMVMKSTDNGTTWGSTLFLYQGNDGSDTAYPAPVDMGSSTLGYAYYAPRTTDGVGIRFGNHKTGVVP